MRLGLTLYHEYTGKASKTKTELLPTCIICEANTSCIIIPSKITVPNQMVHKVDSYNVFQRPKRNEENGIFHTARPSHERKILGNRLRYVTTAVL